MTQSLLQLVGNEINSAFGQRPLFSNGIQIGNYNVDYSGDVVYSDLCSASVDLFSNLTEAQLDKSTWQVQDPLTLAYIPAGQFCMSQGIVPNWFGQSDVAPFIANADGTYTLPSQNHLIPIALGVGLIAVALFYMSRR